jgi:hypothetical protein
MQPLTYRNFSASRAAKAPKLNPLVRIAEEIPLTTSLWFLLSGVLVIAGATAGAVYGFRGTAAAVYVLSFLSLGVLSFVYGSSCWPESLKTDDPDSDASLREARFALNHAFWMMLSGASLASTFIITALMWRRSLDLLLVQILCGATCVGSYCMGTGMVKARTAELTISMLEGDLQDLDDESNWDIPEETEAVPFEERNQIDEAILSGPLREQLEALIANTTAADPEPVIPSHAFAPAEQPLEFVVSDSDSIEDVLSQTIGGNTLDRLVR